MNDFDIVLLCNVTDEWAFSGEIASKMGAREVGERLKVARHLRSLATYGYLECERVTMGQRTFDRYRRKHVDTQ